MKTRPFILILIIAFLAGCSSNPIVPVAPDPTTDHPIPVYK